MSTGEIDRMEVGQIRQSNAGVEFEVLKIVGKRAVCRSVGTTGEWLADLEYLQARSKFIRHSG